MDKLKELQKVIPFHYRLWNGIWKKENINWRNIYEKYSVLAYIDSRDAQNRLDELFWLDREDSYKEIKWRLYCWVAINWKTRRDCWVESNTEQEKWEASDAFKRACVKWWLGRFLYSMPKLYISKEEARNNKYNITDFVKTKYKNEINKRYQSLPDYMKANEK